MKKAVIDKETESQSKGKIEEPVEKSNNEEIIDTEIYEVDRLASTKVEGNQLFYLVKWKDYSEEYDSWEPELRLSCDAKLVEFAKSLIDPDTYIDSIPDILERLENMSSKEIKSLEALSIIAQTTVFCGYVKFALGDTLGSRWMLLKYLRDSNQTYLLHGALIPPLDVVEKCVNQYAKELSFVLGVFPEHPLVKVIVPHSFDTVFYSPPPLPNLLFEPVTEEMFENRELIEHLFLPPSKTEGFNRVQPYIRQCYFSPDAADDPRFVTSGKPYEGMKRIDYSLDPRFPTNLELIHDAMRGWILKASTIIPEDTPIIQMNGVIRPVSFAQRSLQEEGERVAFSSFIEIPGTGKCLDRRNLHDFTKYIPHSCEPTCSVRLVESGNDVPDLVVYAKMDIDSYCSHTISLDYFKGFTREINKYFARHSAPDGKIFALYESNIDFVHCQCLMKKCREVLYIDRSLIRADRNASKKEKLSDLDPNLPFNGMEVCEPGRIWEVNDAMFEE